MVYEFSDLVLDLDRHLLTRDDEPVKLTRLSFKVLRALVQAAPALLSHDELIDQVWGPNRVITPDNLSQRMKTLRQSLGDDPANPRYVEGLRGEGYRLVPEVTIRSPQASSPSTRQTRRPGLVVVLVVVLVGLLAWYIVDHLDVPDEQPAVSPQSSSPAELADSAQPRQPAIAVLPFANLSADPSNQFFTDGIHDDLLTRISNIRNIKTISRTSVMTYRDSDKKVGTIADELGVTTVLEGGVQRSGDQVRINLQLIDAETDMHLWAETYNRELSATNVFTVQAEITEAVAAALQAILTDDEKARIEKRPTTNLQALDAYYLGNQFVDQSTSESIEKAVSAYRSAVELDPEFALAYSSLALAILDQAWLSGYPIQSQLDESRPFIDQAILLDPQSSEAFTALGSWYRRSGDIDKAIQAYDQALALGPGNVAALVNYGNLMQWNLSDPASAIDLYRRAIETDPQNFDLKRLLARALPMVDQAGEGIRMMEGIVAEHPDSAAAYRDLAFLYSNWEFRHDKGIRVLRKAFELDPSHPPNSYWNAIMHWRLADYENTALWMNHIASLVPDSEEARVYRGWAFNARQDFESARMEFGNSNSDSSLYWLGIIYLGNVDAAEGRPLDALARYMDYATEFDGSKSNVNFYYGIATIKAYQALEEEEKAQALIDEFITILDTDPSVTYHDSAIHEASILALSGQLEGAIEILEEWVNQGGATSLLQQNIRHGLGLLEDSPRYQQILQTVDTRLREQMANLARWEAAGEMPTIPRAVTHPE